VVERPSEIVRDLVSLSDDSWIFVLPHAVRTLTVLGVPDVLGDRTLPVAEIAGAVGADEESLFRLLRALAVTGLLHQSGRAFGLGPLGARLRADAENSARESLLNLDSHLAWISAADAIRAGTPSFDEALGARFFQHKDDDQAANRAFLDRMRARACASYPRFPEAVDWSATRTVMDIGGGDGYLLGQVLAHAGHLRGVLFDRQATVDLVAAAQPERVEVRSGDFFKEVPAGADTHLLCSVLHDWTDEQCRAILRNSRKALAPAGRLLVLEMLIPEDGAWHPSVWSDLGMMVLTGGRERGAAEFRALLGDAGYELAAVHPIPDSAFHVLECR
jgi:hypothetical protein